MKMRFLLILFILLNQRFFSYASNKVEESQKLDKTNEANKAIKAADKTNKEEKANKEDKVEPQKDVSESISPVSDSDTSSNKVLYTQALRFDVIGTGLKLEPIKVEYDLSNHTDLKIGPFLVNKHFFQVKYEKINENNRYIFLLKWPELLLSEGSYQLVDAKGTVLLTEEFTKKNISKWKEKRNSLSENSSESDQATIHKEIIKSNGQTKTKWSDYNYAIYLTSDQQKKIEATSTL